MPLGTPGRCMDKDGTIARGYQLIRVVRLRHVTSQPLSIPPVRFTSITSVGVQLSTGSERPAAESLIIRLPGSTRLRKRGRKKVELERDRPPFLPVNYFQH